MLRSSQEQAAARTVVRRRRSTENLAYSLRAASPRDAPEPWRSFIRGAGKLCFVFGHGLVPHQIRAQLGSTIERSAIFWRYHALSDTHSYPPPLPYSACFKTCLLSLSTERGRRQHKTHLAVSSVDTLRLACAVADSTIYIKRYRSLGLLRKLP